MNQTPWNHVYNNITCSLLYFKPNLTSRVIPSCLVWGGKNKGNSPDSRYNFESDSIGNENYEFACVSEKRQL